MGTLVWLGFGLFTLSSLVVGIRLLRRWRVTRQLPELAIAIGLLGIAPLGFTLNVASSLLVPHAESVANWVWGVSALCLNVGTAATYLFSQQVFHPGNRRVLGGVAALAGVLAACWFVELLTTGFLAGESAGPAIRVSDWLRTSALLWASYEATRYYFQLRRRQVLCLADPVVARRFLYWALGTGGAGLSGVIDSTMKLFVEHALDYPALTLLNATAGVVAAVCLYLAFLPQREVEDAAADPAA